MSEDLLFFIDVAPGSGRGHLVRTLQIINQFKSTKWNINIVVEKCESDTYLAQLKKIAKTFNVIEQKELISIRSILKIAEKMECKYVIVDSYKVQYSEITSLEKFIIYRIIDSPVSAIKYIEDIKIGIRFGLQNTDKGLKILYPIRKISRSVPQIRRRRKILFYFGSEPDTKAISAAVKIIHKLPQDSEVYIYAPKVASRDGRINYIDNIDSIISHTSLIIGSASNIMYEATMLNIPMITISTNRSQVNQDEKLLQIGAIFNLSIDDLNESSEMAKLICRVLLNIKLIQQFTKKYKDNIYPDSSKFIADLIVGKNKGYIAKQKILKNSKIQPDIRKLELSNINELIMWRNSSEVRKLMSSTKQISKLSHYNWWFENTRSNYVLHLDNKPYLYLWHQLIIENNKEIFIGGWMPMTSKLSPLVIIDALSWQLQLSQSISKDAIWLAIINKENIFTNFINDRLGFKNIDNESELKDIAAKIFNLSSNNENFYFYKYNFTIQA